MSGELRTYYGPTAWNSDPGAEWHYGCDGRVLRFKEGAVCDRCGAGEDPPGQEETVPDAPPVDLMPFLRVGRLPRAIRWFPGVSCQHPTPIDITVLGEAYRTAMCNACGTYWYWLKIGWSQ